MCIDAEDMQTWNKRKKRREKKRSGEVFEIWGIVLCVCYTNIWFLFVLYIGEKLVTQNDRETRHLNYLSFYIYPRF